MPSSVLSFRAYFWKARTSSPVNHSILLACQSEVGPTHINPEPKSCLVGVTWGLPAAGAPLPGRSRNSCCSVPSAHGADPTRGNPKDVASRTSPLALDRRAVVTLEKSGRVGGDADGTQCSWGAVSTIRARPGQWEGSRSWHWNSRRIPGQREVAAAWLGDQRHPLWGWCRGPAAGKMKFLITGYHANGNLSLIFTEAFGLLCCSCAQQVGGLCCCPYSVRKTKNLGEASICFSSQGCLFPPLSVKGVNVSPLYPPPSPSWVVSVIPVFFFLLMILQGYVITVLYIFIQMARLCILMANLFLT